jgi:hypothetical protein
MKQHPSGRPVRARVVKPAHSKFRGVWTGSAIPRLQKTQQSSGTADAIGYRYTEETDQRWFGIHWAGMK